MSVVSYYVGFVTDVLLIRLVIQIVAGVAVYGIVLKLTSERMVVEYGDRVIGKILKRTDSSLSFYERPYSREYFNPKKHL